MYQFHNSKYISPSTENTKIYSANKTYIIYWFHNSKYTFQNTTILKATSFKLGTKANF